MKFPYVRAIGRLIRDIEAGAGNDAIGASLAAALRLVRPRTAELRLDGDVLQLDDAVVAGEDMPEIDSLRAAMLRHGVTALQLRMGATARELLQFAALLAGAASDVGTPSIFDAVSRLNFWHVGLSGATAPAAPAPTPVASLEPFALSSPDASERDASALEAAFDRALAASQALDVLSAMVRAQRTHDAAGALPTEALPAAVAPSSDEAASDAPAGNDAIIARWRACEEHVQTPNALRLIGALVVVDDVARNTAQLEALHDVLRRAGNAGTAALMQHLSAATSTTQRRALFDTIVALGTGVPVLTAHLEHKSWYVVRNAACLLGALRATDAEPQLVAALGHQDERVRTSIATALVQLGTQSARRALERAIRDASSEVRRRAMRGLLTEDGLARSAAVLSEAVDLERDPEVQMEVLGALKELATPHAVNQLVRLCSPSVLSGKSAAFRKEAMEALVALRPAAAAPLLRIQAQDRDPEVRALAQVLMERVKNAA